MQASSLAVRWAALSDVGLQRVRNEDAFLVEPARSYAVVADGMGGHNAGDVAARIVIDTIGEVLRQRLPEHGVEARASVLRAAVLAANDAVRAAAARDRGLTGMGATVVVANPCADGLIFASVGDSRLYRLRAGRLDQLTHDHTMLQELVDGGMISPEQARRVPFRGMLTRALGVEDEVLVDVGRTDLQPGDLLLMCSDGLTDMVDADELASLLAAPGDVQACAATLVASANAEGGRDNITVVLAAVTDDRSPNAGG
ncbi:Stp1/IreP family PP2C-type Ser/Thr phosphatase [Zoogloeaceae bacteirum Par-f-2]|nr:Stp1/IreP family PP2C-type Ser/Thr phosphatase [Zoogloeaceae bacteirum Par-f-2]